MLQAGAYFGAELNYFKPVFSENPVHAVGVMVTVVLLRKKAVKAMSLEIDITFLRHGRSRADDEGVHEGRYDSPLTELGRAQARIRGQDFLERELHFDLVIASSLQRARETAEIIAQMFDAPVVVDPDWMEMDNGPLAGMPREVAAERYPIPAKRNPYEAFHGSGESNWEMYTRAARALERVVRRGPGRYLVVAHGGIFNDALRTITGAQPLANGQGLAFHFGDTGYARCVYKPARHLWTFLELNPG
jgi:2,3-bisphosphoglycerate-dependent phosphoglycerate mutase